MTNPYKGFNPLAYPQGSITQYFAENPALYASMNMKGHNGWDCVAPWGTPMVAVMPGVIGEVKEDPTGYGKHIRLLCDIGDGMLLEWVYGHLSRIDVVAGQEMKEGEQVGLMGNTGFVVSGSTPYWQYNPYAGTHLHIGVREVKKTLPGETYSVSYLNDQPEKRITGLMLNYDNGYLGSIDPQPFLSNTVPRYDPSKYGLTGQSIINQLKVLREKLAALQK